MQRYAKTRIWSFLSEPTMWKNENVSLLIEEQKNQMRLGISLTIDSIAKEPDAARISDGQEINSASSFIA